MFSITFKGNLATSGPNLDLSRVQQLDVALLCQNYGKLYSHAKHLEKGMNGGWWNFWRTFFFKKVSILANIGLSNLYLSYKLEYLITTMLNVDIRKYLRLTIMSGSFSIGELNVTGKFDGAAGTKNEIIVFLQTIKHINLFIKLFILHQHT